MNSFVHLHVHSQYSILDGQASISKLVSKAIEHGMPAIALTDHGNMFGVMEFFNTVSKKNSPIEAEIKKLRKELGKLTQAGAAPDAIESMTQQIASTTRKLFKPIIGCEVYVAREGRLVKGGREHLSGHHLILLAKNKKGYHNLVKLVSKGWIEGFYGRPRIDKEILREFSEGLIVSSACLAGEIPRLIKVGKMDEAEKAVLWFKELFGADYYLEMQRHQTHDPNANQEVYPEQRAVNTGLMELSKRTGVKLIATNDVHFVNAEDADAHDLLLCLNTGADLHDPKRMRYTKQEWFKTPQEMATVFHDLPEALATTLEIAEKVEFFSINSDAIMPIFPLPAEFHDDGEYLRHLTYEGAKLRYPEMSPEHKERIDFEIETILHMGFPGYFLIVQDFIAEARRMGVSVGPGRGSAAGSVVAYCLGITDIDPIKYDLLFERFLNPDRISLPDIDIDFDDDGRGQVLQWVTEKYGKEKVAHIITFGTMATKSAIKDVARVQKLPLSESDRLTKLVPDKIPNVKKVTVKAAIDYVRELRDAAESPNQILRDTMKFAQMLEGNVRNTGVHACGVIIGRDDLTNYVPISTADDKETGEKMLVSQYEGSVIEDVGMLKMDFLGLKTLSIIKDAVENVQITTGKKIDIATISLEDTTTYELYSSGRTTGTFQFESAGMQKYLRELKPTTFEDLIAMNALYRPGPMEYIPSFVARKHGREAISYDIPIMERYLKDTYGITVYQEQVMLLSRLLANFTRGQSDELRKAMGKKLIDKMNALKVKFMEGCAANGHNLKVCEKIWGDWEKFASYAFNKSHATCYSWIAYQTAYLKANYPSEYMAAVLSRNISNITDITKFMDECKSMTINVLGPDVNESLHKFAVNKRGDIRFGLGAIKGVGENAVQSIIEERRANGPFSSVYNFMERVNLSACNKKNIEGLIVAGAFDALESIRREQYFAPNEKGEIFLEVLMRYGVKMQADRAVQSNSLFGDDHDTIAIATPEPPQCEAWSDLHRLNKERELVGIYLSAHPLDEYQIVLEALCNTTMEELKDKDALMGREVVMGGMVTTVREGSTKNGNPYGVMTIEDYSGVSELIMFGNEFVDKRKYFYPGLFLLGRGRMEPRRFKQEEFELKIHTFELLSEIKEKAIQKITITIPVDQLSEELITDLTALLDGSEGEIQLNFELVDHHRDTIVPLRSTTKKIAANKNLLQFLKGRDEISYRIN